MNIKQNIVQIKTGSQMGTGIIYPCETNKWEYDKSKFIIFTNKHVVEEIYDEIVDVERIKLLVDFDLYDKNGNLINNDNIEEIKLFVQGNDDTEDVAAILIIYKYKISIDLEKKIIWDDTALDNIYIEGFPRVLFDNEISSKIQLKGKYKEIFPKNYKIGIFKISDDYHWYSNYKDLQLFQGFSGSPIYSSEYSCSYIVGMNRSMLNIDEGENPFKLLYYYKIKFVLEYLREQGCIIFKRNEDDSASIRWIFRDEKENRNEDNKIINLLLLGSSGAGKSSFAKTFLLHSRLIDSTNDGQTTRSNIRYKVSLYEKEPKVTIKFLNKDQFIRRMMQINYANYLLKTAKIVFKEKNINSLEALLQYLLFSKKLENEEIVEIKDKIEKLLWENDKFSPKDREDYYGEVCDVVEYIIEKKVENNNKFISDNKSMLKDVLEKVEGFFDIKEFSFLFDGGTNSVESNDEKLENDNNLLEEDKLYKFFKSYYEKIHNEIMERLKREKIVAENNYSLDISFIEEKKISDLLPLCLQVKNERSLTGIVDYVNINDSISNEYSFIIDDLGISKLQLFDTYGLDHANWDKDKGNVLSSILYDLQDKEELDFKFNSDLAVLYIKKLDSGKPTELKAIIPQIYKMIPQAPVYCIFNGLDIFLGSDIDEYKFNDYYNVTDKIPKSVKYLLGKDGRKDILDMIGDENKFGENLYNTLKNNIISFCSNEDITQKIYNIYENNIKWLYKLLLSICMKEYSSMNIIPERIVENLEKTEKYDDKIDEVIKEIFEKSSKTNWSKEHWNTRRANFRRISGEKEIELGHWGIYQHRWNQLFHRGYVSAIAWKNDDFLGIRENVGYIYSIDSCIRNMEEEFLGPSYQLGYKHTGLFDAGNKFKKLIKEMYKKGIKYELYKSDPFENIVNITDPVEYLNDVCDFKKGYELIKKDLIKYFKEVLVIKIKDENRAKAENLLKINSNFHRQLSKLEFDFNKKYPEVSFKDLLKYYSESKDRKE